MFSDQLQTSLLFLSFTSQSEYEPGSIGSVRTNTEKPSSLSSPIINLGWYCGQIEVMVLHKLIT